MSDILGSEWFHDDDESREILFERFFKGRLTSRWAFLRRAIASNFEVACSSTAYVIQNWRRMLNDDRHVGEVELITSLQYIRMCFGPLVGSIALTPFAIESLVKTLAHTYSNYPNRHPSFSLGGCNALPFRTRVHTLLTYLTPNCELEENLKKRLEALILYRNDLAHDPPTILQYPGVQETSTGASTFDSSRYSGWFVSLSETEGGLPRLSLNHAMRAIMIHDEIVMHLGEYGIPEFMAYLEKTTTLDMGIIGHMLPGKLMDRRFEELLSEVRRFLEWRNTISAEDREAAYRNLVRMQIKAVE